MQSKGFLRRLSGEIDGLLHVLWIYLTVSGRFLRWRLQLWLQQSGMVESTQIRMKRTLLVIRHGQTTWNVEHRLPGQVPGVTLSDTGRQQVARLLRTPGVDRTPARPHPGLEARCLGTPDCAVMDMPRASLPSRRWKVERVAVVSDTVATSFR